MRRALPLALAALLLLPTAASAQPSGANAVATAQALYDQAVTAMDAKDFASACPKLEEALRLQPAAIGGLLTLAECYEGAGKLASAWTSYALAEAAAAKAGQGERQKKAHDRAAALKPRLSTLTVSVADPVRALPGLEIRRDDVPVGPVQWGIGMPADRGRHVIIATAPGKQRWEKVFEISADGAPTTVLVDMLVDVVPWAPPPAIPSSPMGPVGVQPAPPLRPPTEARSTPWGAQRIAGVAVGGAGLIGIGVGAFFGLRAIDRKDESNANGHCHDGNVCDDEGIRLRNDGLSAATGSTVAFVVGGVALAGGVTLFLTAPKSKTPPLRVAVGPRGVALVGGW